MNAAENGDLPHGDHLVCPRCGTAAGEGVWCSGCGLNLKQQGDLPTGDAYAAKVRERRWLDEQERQARNQREAEAARKAADRERRAREEEQARSAAAARRHQEKERQRREGEDKEPSRKRRWLAGIATVVVLVLACAAGAFALTGGFDSTDEESDNPAAQTADPEPDGSPRGMEGGAAEPVGEVFFTDLAGETESEPAELLIFQQIPVLDLEWESWGGPTTEGTGIAARSDCEPNCAEGSIVGSDITITLSDIQECGGRRQYATGSYVLNLEQGEEERGTFENTACESTTSGDGSEFEPSTGESPITPKASAPCWSGCR